MEYKDYYNILGVDRTTDKAEIKKAYRKLARKYHPDVSKEPDAEARFKDVSEAYNVLRDEEKRAAYDELGSNWQAGQDFHTPPGWEGAHPGFTHAGDGDYQYYSSHGQGAGPDVSDFFESLFGRSGFSGESFSGAEGYRTGEDQHASVQIDLADAYQGTSRQLSLNEVVINEAGQAEPRKRTLSIRIPRGISQGQTMRLKGQGTMGFNGERGDLFLEVSFAPHSVYSVDGKDITLELPVAPWEAALGEKVAVPLPDGKSVNVTLSPGSSSGKKLRLKGKGIPAKVPGNLYVKLKIVLPETISEQDREAYESLKAISGFDARANLKQQLRQH